MGRIKTFPDAGVLINAARAGASQSAAFTLLADPGRQLLASRFLRLETWPKAAYMRRQIETELYRWYFEDHDVLWCHELARICDLADQEAERLGLGGFDALHVAAAHLLGADELVTTERPEKALFRTELVRVVRVTE